MDARSSFQIAGEFRRRIDAGEWKSGSRLPAERALAAELAVARNTVRRALAALESEGLLARHVGRGTFVQGRPKRHADALAMQLREASPSDVMEVRLIIEPQAVALAASRASGAELAAIDEAFRHSLAARGIAEFEHWDGQLHLRIVGAAKNALLTDYCRAITEARNQPRWYQLKKRSLNADRRFRYDQHHTAIVSALKDRDPDAAARLMREHLLVVQANLLGLS
jgi:DNA-binding FadR family transcriptional regulator